MITGEKLKVQTFYVLPLTGKPKQQQFTRRSGILTSINSRQCSAIRGSPLPGPALCSSIEPPMPQPAHYGFHLTMFSGNDSLFLVASSTRYWLLLIYLLRKVELAWEARVYITCSRVLLESDPGGTRSCKLWVASPRPYHHNTEPHHKDNNCHDTLNSTDILNL